ncbi:MAG: transposase [Opitutaceae bacterium]|nr:transposase [Opitutaceae bacterium]
MARKPRLQFEGAIYHVINRGNYRRDIFETAGAAQAFEQCLFEACAQAGWRLYAYAIMRNHFHLAVETPRANLVEGMHWLQSTFAIRFNRFRDERGHLFQSRYRAILVEGGPHLARVVNYIHLNPLRAGIVSLEQLAQFRWCSYRRFLRGERPEFLVCEEWLLNLGGLTDSREGWQRYQDYLGWLTADAEEQKRQAFDKMCSGWAIGSDGWRKALAKDHAETVTLSALRGPEVRELKEAAWAAVLDQLLAERRKTRREIEADGRTAAWKVGLALRMRESTTATNEWIAGALGMGKGSSLSVYLSKEREKIKK